MTVVVAAAAGYAVGCLCAGYYLVRLTAGEDIRCSGSGSAGATNVGRRLGVSAFALTMALDCAKGAAVAWAARDADPGAIVVAAAVIATVSGHVWPAQLGFRGGKGIATSLGAFAVYDVRIIIVIAAVFALGFVLLRRFVLSGLIAYAAGPLVLLPLGVQSDRVATMIAVATVVLVAHRSDLRAAVRAASSARTRASDRRGTSG
jgi:acyl phosphate:glycerol-3-phosphate acyltransferase